MKLIEKKTIIYNKIIALYNLDVLHIIDLFFYKNLNLLYLLNFYNTLYIVDLNIDKQYINIFVLI
jgi:hypothetical protein